jgi:hypothetical protein
MPADQRVGLDDLQGISPLEQLGKLSQRETNPAGRTPRFLFSINV